MARELVSKKIFETNNMLEAVRMKKRAYEKRAALEKNQMLSFGWKAAVLLAAAMPAWAMQDSMTFIPALFLGFVGAVFAAFFAASLAKYFDLTDKAEEQAIKAHQLAQHVEKLRQDLEAKRVFRKLPMYEELAIAA